MDSIKVFLIDDHKIFRDGIISLFTDEEDIEVCCVASDGYNIIKQLKINHPDVLILDISMPELSGIDVMRKIYNAGMDVNILILSMHSKEEYIFKAISAGAKGYLPKEDTSKTELLKAVRIVAQGNEYFPESLSNIMKEHSINEAGFLSQDHNKHKLTAREMEVLQLVVEGLSNKEISDKLFVNIRTVETHKTNILQKLELKNTVQLVKYAIKNKLLEI